MAQGATRFPILLAEDDPVSREFLAAALRACGTDPTDCADGNSALDLARAQKWNLLIFDHHLPGRNGDEVLAQLRSDPDAASRTAPAIATSAARDIELASLLDAGFTDVLPKPVSVEVLQATLRKHNFLPDSPLDDEDALRACGSAAAVARLRRLFAEQELPKLHAELERARDDPYLLRSTLHRLHASCGFCGARTLARASAALHRALATGASSAEVQSALEAFRNALAATGAALHADSRGAQPDGF
ncbi:MAG TPA: response regulator [Rhodanobacteraceae bacterium]|nr:response regulator [Rhodanobacteraceae bacterium]